VELAHHLPVVYEVSGHPQDKPGHINRSQHSSPDQQDKSDHSRKELKIGSGQDNHHRPDKSHHQSLPESLLLQLQPIY
jgi:hypothetical protein